MQHANSADTTPLASRGFRLAMAAGLLICLTANLPGHLSLDSVIALHEARTGVRETWAPAVVSWILKLFDQLLSGTGLYVTVSTAVLFFSWMSLTALRGRASWLAVLLGVAAVLTPQVLIYQGIVWKDVLFANVVIAAFVLLAHAARRWDERRLWVSLGAAAICLALAALIRPNGAILALAAAAALAWTARGRGWKSSAAWSLGGLLVVALLALGIDHLAQPKSVAPGLRPDAAALVLQHYDVVGAVARDPSIDLDIIGAAKPASRTILVANAKRLYSAARVDTLDTETPFRQALWRMPDPVMSAQWREVVLHHTGAYLTHRAAVFRWVVATPKLELCLPVHVGVSAPEPLLHDLGMVAGMETQDVALADYAARFMSTPVYSHVTWIVVALLAAGLMLIRRSPADVTLAAMLLGVLGFAASFFVISVACDYRYLYVVDLSAMTALLYLAMDPAGWRRREG